MNGDANHSSSPASYSAQLAAFRASDEQRDLLVAEVISKYEQLQAKFAGLSDDYNNEVESRRMWQAKAKSHEQALVEHKQASGSNSFVLVVLDGDGAIFQDYLLAMGKDGGSDAAHQLHSEIKNDLKLDGSTEILVQVICNLQGLTNKLLACGIVSNPNEVFAFARAFGLAQPLFNFIDVGVGKERADYKIRETLRVFLPNAQCKHVYFGPCNDNGYVCVLERYKRDYASRLTLIEARPAEQGFADLGFKRVSFPRLFRTENLPAKPVSLTGPVLPPTPVSTRSSSIAQMHANIPPFIPQSTSPAPSSDSGTSQTTSWATVGRNGTAAKTINVASTKKAPVKKFILLNVHDERLDAELPRTDPGAEKRFTDRLKSRGKMCNKYHLTGICDAEQYCDYYHGERLSPGEQLVLKHKARSRTCPQRDMCRDLECTFGHHCKFGKSCYLDNCWFGYTHLMDTEPAKKFYEDGTQEYIQAYLQKFRT